MTALSTLPDLLTWENLEIPYRYYCSRRRRTLGISVYPDLSVLVRAPFATSREEIRRFVLERAGWIVRTQRRLEQHVSEPLLYRSGETHHYIGKQYRLELKQGQKDCITCLRGCLVVTIRHEPTEEKAKKLLDVWYRARADILFHERLAACQQRATQEGIPLPALRIRKMRTRWGSFSSKGKITLNLLLIMAPIECLDYVILHELCHHKVRRHGPRFWGLLKRLMPDYEERQRELNAAAMTLRLP
jgi:predicted metal-dependent hydrolase